MALTTRQLDYLARQDTYLEPIFKGVFASDQLSKEKDIQTRSVYIVNVDTHDQKGSHRLSIFVEKDQCEVFDSYGLPLHWYIPSPFVTWVFKHYQDVSSNVEQLQGTDSNTCGHYALFFLFARARGKLMESFVQPFKYLRYVDNDQKIDKKLRKLVTPKLFNLGQEENQQSVLTSVKKHVSLLDIEIKDIAKANPLSVIHIVRS